MIKKAGTILINKHDIGLIYRDNYDDYSFPKGHQYMMNIILIAKVMNVIVYII